MSLGVPFHSADLFLFTILTQSVLSFSLCISRKFVILLFFCESIFRQWSDLDFLQFLALINTGFSFKSNYTSKVFCHILRFLSKWRFPLQIFKTLVSSGSKLWGVPFSYTSFSLFSLGPFTFEAIASTVCCFFPNYLSHVWPHRNRRVLFWG